MVAYARDLGKFVHEVLDEGRPSDLAYHLALGSIEAKELKQREAAEAAKGRGKRVITK